MNSFKFKKAVQVLNYFAQKEGGEINYMKAVKLVWLSDRAHLRIYGRTITNDQYVAMKNGPVPSGTKDLILKSPFFESEVLDYTNKYLSKADDYVFSSIGAFDDTLFSKTDLKIMDDIYNTYGDKSQYELRDYSHQFPEWKRFETELNLGKAKVFNIIETDFFENGIKEKPFAQSDELLSLSRQHFLHIL